MSDDYPDWYERQDQLLILSVSDESEGYDIDQNIIGLDIKTGKFYFMSASGCSYWESNEYDESEFDSFEKLKKYLLSSAVGSYAPGLVRSQAMIEEATKALKEYKKTVKKNA